MSVLVWLEHESGTVTELSRQAVSLGQDLAAKTGTTVEGVSFGEVTDPGVGRLLTIEHPLLDEYAPGAWGEALAQVVAAEMPVALVAAGSDRGNEVLAHVAALVDLPMAANVSAVTEVGETWRLVRVRWGGSLLEEADLTAPTRLLSAAPHVFPVADGGAAETVVFTPELDQSHLATRVTERVEAEGGITLATAPVVVSGGRGVGSADGFAPLEELAALLGGAVGCSRVVTNNGWRPHSDQVGQTGTRVAPELYIACGISGAIQHWVGMMASKHVLAINTDREAPMVTKADYALIGDVAEIVPALVAEVRRRRG